MVVGSCIAPVSSKEFLDIQATIECRFTRVRGMIITHNRLKAGNVSEVFPLTGKNNFSETRKYFLRVGKILNELIILSGKTW